MSNKDPIVYGKNAVFEIIQHSPESIRKVYFVGSRDADLKDIKIRALHNKISIHEFQQKKEFEKQLARYTKNAQTHQNVFAVIQPYVYYELNDLLRETSDHSKCLILAHITDTANFGAIIRSAVAFHMDFIIIPKDRSVEVNATVYKTSSGLVSRAKIVKVTNLAIAIQKLKEARFWIYSADSKAEKSILDIDFSGKTAIVMGSEEKGPGHAVEKAVDDCFKIPIQKGVESLNVSVSAGICMYVCHLTIQTAHTN